MTLLQNLKTLLFKLTLTSKSKIRKSYNLQIKIINLLKAELKSFESL